MAYTQQASTVVGAVAQHVVTISIAAPGIITWAAHGQPVGAAVTFENSGGALPTGLVAGTIYYVSSQSYAAGQFAVSTTYANAIAGTSITTSGVQSGTQYAVPLQSPTFYPLAGRMFNIVVNGSFTASIQLEKYVNATIGWVYPTADGTQLYIWTANAFEQFEDDQYGQSYRLNCTSYTSGTINYQISQ